MKCKALTSFSGVISMSKNEVRELKDENLIKDLTKAGYIMPLIEIKKGKPVKKSKKGGRS